MLSSFLVFLGLYISMASTSPITSNSAPLVPRQVPADDRCAREGYEWQRRECVSGSDIRKWKDVCTIGVNIEGFCEPDTMCQDDIDDDFDFIIKCVPIEGTGETVPRKRKADPQIGMSPKKRAVWNQLTPTQLSFGVEILDEMEASVTGTFLDEDQTYAIKPVNVIVGKIRGKEITVCSGSYSDEGTKARTCYPNGRYQLYKGDWIDYTWGLMMNQVGMLAYGIFPF